MPYNAYKAIFQVFDRFGGLMYEQVINDPCNGIPPGSIFWDGYVNGQLQSAGVYTYTLRLTNCFEKDKLALSGDVTLSPNSCPSFTDSPIANSSKQNNETILFNENIISNNYINLSKSFERSKLNLQPNPVSKNIEISYDLDYDTKISLFVYDINGKLVEKIINNASRKKGNYKLNYNLSRLLKGMYYSTLKTNREIITKKIIKINAN